MSKFEQTMRQVKWLAVMAMLLIAAAILLVVTAPERWGTALVLAVCAVGVADLGKDGT